MTALDVEKIVRRKTERKELLRSSLDNLLPQLESLGAIRVVLFGSLVDGTTHSRSDLDILVVMPQERSGRDWSHIIYENVDLNVAADILVFNANELAEGLETNRFLRQVVEKGRPVFERES
ncbi:MAG: nucleotidyltransferase domain-containing protein [Actinomycetota bacterium]|nr:nucleotidyltransferase domain-containing protein [Actinomycetota bacterium]